MSNPAMSEGSWGRSAAEHISFLDIPDKPGVRILDLIERRQFDVVTNEAVSPEPTGEDQFVAPVDSAIEVRVQAVSYPSAAAMYVRDESGSLVTVAEQETDQILPADTYVIELNAPIKVYLRVEGPLAIRYEDGETTIDIDGSRAVNIGVRSHHKHPAGTVTTTEDPTHLMAAIETLGSALKTTSPERSYPTLRGHPPLIEFGEDLEIPSVLTPPETGVRIEVPANLAKIFEVTPLVYYLGATVRSATSSRIVTDSGFAQTLESGRGFRKDVARTLKQVFFLDCLARTEGMYTIDLHERRRFEDRTDLDFSTLFDMPLEKRLERYLEVPYETVEDLIPKWKLTTHVAPRPTSVEVLPFAMNELALVHAQTRSELSTPAAQAEPIEGFTNGESAMRSPEGATDTPLDSLVQPGATNSLGQAWFGEGAPIGATKASIDAYRNRLGRSPGDEDISIAVVRNDPRMDSTEEVGDIVYQPRETLPFDVSFHRDLPTDEMRDLFSREIDFLHYIGHVDTEGFECPDGTLDVASVSDIGIDSFFLNACRSYHQGMALIENGAVGGVVTLNNVVNTEAVSVGRTLGRLLSQGFPLRPALAVARRESLFGHQYVVVGDGEVTLAQPDGGTPYVGRFERGDDAIKIELEMYPTTQKGMGSMFMPSVGDGYVHFLNGGIIGPISADESEVSTIFEEEDLPILIDGELRWSSEIEIKDLE